MRASRGFTLLEVLLSIAISAMLLPVMSIAFYQLMVIPPNKSLHLSLTNEMATLSSYLYSDGYMSENFSKGTYPTLGEFSWTDYTSDDHYLVRYYHSYDSLNGSRVNRQMTVTHNYSTTKNIVTSNMPLAWLVDGTSGSCNNFSLNKVSNTNGSYVVANITAGSKDAIGKYVQKQLTLYIGSRPSSYVTSNIYTYCTGSGIDKWAWGKTWSHIDGKTNAHPWSPDDFLSFTSTHLPPYPLYPASAENYSAMCGNDSSGCATGYNTTYWRYANTSDSLEFGYDTNLFKFKIVEDRAHVANLTITWTGHGSQGDRIYHTYIMVWNSSTGSSSTGSWYTLLDKTKGLPSDIPPGDDMITCFNQYVFSLTTNVSNFIDTTGNVSILLKAEDPSIPATQGGYTDYIELKVQ